MIYKNLTQQYGSFAGNCEPKTLTIFAAIMKIEQVTLDLVIEQFQALKPDLIDAHATYFGLWVGKALAGIVSFQVHPTHVYLCHAFVKDEHRQRGYYNMLWEYRNSYIQQHLSDLEVVAHCNTSSLKQFLNKGFEIEKALFKVIKK